MSEIDIHCLECNSEFEKDEVAILKCKHSFCWSCLSKYIESNLNAKIKCPSKECMININDNVIRQALPNDKIDEYEKKSFSVPNIKEQCFKCLLPQCENFVFFTDKNIQFECSRCSLFNCISCAGTHPFMSCKDYQKLKESTSNEKMVLINMQDNEFLRASMKLQMDNQVRKINENLNLESSCFISNDKMFTCTICCRIITKETGIKLRNCSHMFCRLCLHGAIINSEVIPIPCLDSSCECTIQDREVRGILNEEEYEIFQEKSLMLARSKLQNICHCKKPDCKYFGICDDVNLENFVCPVCMSFNCFKCNAIHNGFTCEQFKISSNPLTLDLKSIEFIEKEIKEGKCMKCPTCGCVIKKAGGCNWIKCPQCKLELCWILKIPRWGPKGNGDTSGGCKCGVNNVLCSPDCFVGCIPEK